jgi:hypothetical protein
MPPASDLNAVIDSLAATQLRVLLHLTGLKMAAVDRQYLRCISRARLGSPRSLRLLGRILAYRSDRIKICPTCTSIVPDVTLDEAELIPY